MRTDKVQSTTFMLMQLREAITLKSTWNQNKPIHFINICFLIFLWFAFKKKKTNQNVMTCSASETTFLFHCITKPLPSRQNRQFMMELILCGLH